MQNPIEREDFSAGLSSVPDYPKTESSNWSTDVADQMLNNNSKFSQKSSKDDLPLDDILKELLEEQKTLNLVKTSQKWYPSVTSSGRDSTGTESRSNARSVAPGGWQVSQSGPARSEFIAKETVDRCSPNSQIETSSTQKSHLLSGWNGSYRSSPEATNNKWGLSKPRMWTFEERKNEERRPEAPFASESPKQRTASFLSREFPESAPAERFHSREMQSSSTGPVQFVPSSREEYHSRPHGTLSRSRSSGYRNCASDSEDPMSWLEEQHSKLRMKHDGMRWKQRSQQEKRLLSELKTAQNTIRLHKRSQSDTEDAISDDSRANAVNSQTLSQVRENRGDFNKFGPSDQIQTNGSVAKGLQGRIDEVHIQDIVGGRVESRPTLLQDRRAEPAMHELPKHYTGTVNQNGRASWESSQTNGLTSPKTPIRSDSSREVVLRALENNFTMKSQDTPSLDDVERSLILTLESLSRSKQDQISSDNELHQRLSAPDVRSQQRQKVEGSPVSAANPCLSPDQKELQEFIKLKPIGQGVRNLEPAADAKSLPTSYPVQVVVSPFPLSPVTPYDNQGMSTVRRQPASVPLSQTVSVDCDGNTTPSSTSKISQKPDTMTFDLTQQQQLIRQKLLQQQLKQQQLQQQLQQLQQLQQQHQLIQQQLQEQRQHQQQLQQQQQQIEPRVQQHMMQQQQMLEQQLLQQQQQLLMLQQQLQLEQVQQQTEHEQHLQDNLVQSQGVFDNNRGGTAPNQHNGDFSQDDHRMLSEAQQYQQRMKPTPPAEKNANMQQQQSWHLTKGGTGLQQAIVQQENNALQQKSNVIQNLHQVNSFIMGADCSASQQRHQSAQQPDFYSKQQSELQQQQPAAVQSSGQQKDIVEKVIQKVHVAVSGGDRGIPSLESVLGLQWNKTAQSSNAHQQASQGTTGTASNRDMLSGFTVDTATSAHGLQKSPPSSVGSGQSLKSPNQTIRTPGGHCTIQRTFSGPASPCSGVSRDDSLLSNVDGVDGGSQMPRFVRDTSKFWHKPNVTRDEVIAFLKDKTPGSFIVRNSNTFQGAYGLAIKVAHIPAHVQPRSGDLEAELVRHFLIESTPKGVRLKGCSNEPTFGSLTALVYQHTITPLALPCKLILPELGVLDAGSVSTKSSGPTNNDAQLAGSNVRYISSTDLESLTGPEAISRAIEQTFGSDKQPPKITEVHFKVTPLGITLTDNKRRLFFRRHYPFNTITHCSLDTKDRRWTVKDDNDKAMSTGRVFGFVARKMGSTTENTCHLFSELDPTQPASAIVNFVTRIMISCESAAQT